MTEEEKTNKVKLILAGVLLKSLLDFKQISTTEYSKTLSSLEKKYTVQ